MAKRPVGMAKVKLWTQSVTMDFEGTIAACALEAFGAINSAQARLYILELMKELHSKLCEVEAEQAKSQ